MVTCPWVCLNLFIGLGKEYGIGEAMPSETDKRSKDEIERMKQEMAKEQDNLQGFIESYKDFLDKWGSYRKSSAGTADKRAGKSGRSVFKMTTSM